MAAIPIASHGGQKGFDPPSPHKFFGLITMIHKGKQVKHVNKTFGKVL